jgi:hypothetical protein
MTLFPIPQYRAVIAMAVAATLAACRSGLHCFTSAESFRRADLKDQAILLLPVAVTDELGDDRTGIVLDRSSRHRAARLACDAGPKIREDVRIVCFDDPSIAASPALRDVYTQFARDVPISLERLHEIARSSGASFALLFRPEDVHASTRVTRFPDWRPFEPAPSAHNPRASITTTRTFTLLGQLVDLRSGQVVRAAMRSSTGSTDTPEPPVASTHLHGIMRDLMSDMLD